MIAADRRRQIVKTVNEKGKISVGEISDLFDVSEMTARRDLRELDQEGLLRRVYGGAISRLGRSYEPPYNIRTSENPERKRLIGAAAAGLILDGDSVAFDVGTTTLEVARAIDDVHNLTIVTASLPIANEIVSSHSLEEDIRLIIAGGVVRARELSMIGHLAQHAFSELRVDKAFVGVGGLSIEGGLTEYNLEDALVKRPMMDTAKNVIVVADGSKIGRTTFALINPIESIDVLVTDSSAPKDEVTRIRGLGINVVIADQ